MVPAGPQLTLPDDTIPLDFQISPWIRREADLGVFEFVIVIVVVSTIGKVVTDWNDRRTLPPPSGTADGQAVEALHEAIADLDTRLRGLEEERDFYKELLEAPKESRGLGLPEPPRGP